MKVNKLAPEKGARASSLKWRNTKAQRCTTRVNVSELPSTPVMVKMIKEHQAAVKKKPKVKRLERKAMTVSGSKEKKHTSFESEKTYLANTNGKSEVTMNIDADDWQEWSTNGKSSLGNGEKSADGVETVSSGRLEGESFHCCAERDEDRNHAVLVMQKSQVYKAL